MPYEKILSIDKMKPVEDKPPTVSMHNSEDKSLNSYFQLITQESIIADL